jgi:hypothetical protein
MLVGIRASLRAVLDLTKPTNFLPHPELEELLREDWRRRNSEKKESRSQALGRVVAGPGGGYQRRGAIPELLESSAILDGNPLADVIRRNRKLSQNKATSDLNTCHLPLQLASPLL